MCGWLVLRTCYVCLLPLRRCCRYIFHEVRGPLNSLNLSLELLASSPIVQAHPELKELVDVMSQSTSTVRVITDDVLFIGKVESGTFVLDFSPLCLNDVAGTVLQQLQPVTSARGINMAVEITSDLPLELLLGVPSRIRQVLMNLVGNCA